MLVLAIPNGGKRHQRARNFLAKEREGVPGTVKAQKERYVQVCRLIGGASAAREARSRQTSDEEQMAV